MQNLVGKRVPDAAEETWIRQRTLQRVILAAQRRLEIVQRAIQNLESPAVECRQRLLASYHMKGCALFRACFGQDQRSGSKLECGKANLASQPSVRFPPLKPTRNHQMNNQEVFVVEDKNDLLSQDGESSEPSYRQARMAEGRRIAAQTGSQSARLPAFD